MISAQNVFNKLELIRSELNWAFNKLEVPEIHEWNRLVDFEQLVEDVEKFLKEAESKTIRPDYEKSTHQRLPGLEKYEVKIWVNDYGYNIFHKSPTGEETMSWDQDRSIALGNFRYGLFLKYDNGATAEIVIIKED